jgi:hypothetical protein
MTFTVTYNGNGASGQVPVDSNIYAATGGGTVNDGVNDTTKAPYEQTDSNGNPLGIVTGNLTLGGATFLYWNTKADGSGVIHGWPADTSFLFPAQATNLTLWAQWAITTGLPNNGVTTHYTFAYDSSLQASGLEPGRTKTLMGASEADYAIMSNPMTGWFPGVTPSGPSPIPVYVTRLTGGANNTGTIRLRPNTTDPNELRCLLIAEVTESFMHGQNKGWGFLPGVSNEESCGEALSLFLTQQFELSQGIAGPYTAFPGNNWLNSSLPVANSASTRFYSGDNAAPQGYDYRIARRLCELRCGRTPATALERAARSCSSITCSTNSDSRSSRSSPLHLVTRTVCSIPQPRCAASIRTSPATPAIPSRIFAQLLATRPFHPGQVSAVPDPNPDDPWPLASLAVLERQEHLSATTRSPTSSTNSAGLYTNGFYLALDGFNRQVLGNNPTPATPTIAFGGVTVQPSAPPTVIYQFADPRIPQRVLFNYDIHFAPPPALGAFPASGETPVPGNASITVLSQAFPAQTEFFFLAGADPYFANVQPNPLNPTNQNLPWLSQDLRVFTATPGAVGGQFPVPSRQYVAPSSYPVPPGAPTFVENSTAYGDYDIQGAYGYVTNLIGYLNEAYGDPSKADPFDINNSILPGQTSAYTGDSSVTPGAKTSGTTYNNYNFAVARVRLRGSSGPSGTASGIKVFFRLWQTQTADTDWNPGYTYLSDDPTGLNPQYPKSPPDNHTIPFFALGNYPVLNDTPNNQTITINQSDQQWAYFACFLNLYDQNFSVNGQSVQQQFAQGTHHCLVAEIACKDAPIQNVGSATETTENSAQLAQRNLQVTTSANPGNLATHRIPQTFDIRRTDPKVPGLGLSMVPDELMIDWGNAPSGCSANIYWPGANATEILSISSRIYGALVLSAADSHTIRCTTVHGVTYVPIPPGTGESLAGLLTIDLPATVVKGQEFNIVVRRIGTRLVAVTAPPPPPQVQIITREEPAKEAVKVPASILQRLRTERYVIGSFQVKIPVKSKGDMLPAEETTLAIFKARLAAMSPTNRWRPVLERYIGLLAARVDGLGGNASAIPPSFQGSVGGKPAQGGHDGDYSRHREKWVEHTGKISDLIFDHFGDFEGFILTTEEREHRFLSREIEIRTLAEWVWFERLRITVFAEGGGPLRPVKIIVREPPAPFNDWRGRHG